MAFWPYVRELDGHGNSCDKCRAHPQVAKVWGCVDNADLPENRRTLYRLGDETTTFICPLKTISSPFVQHSVQLFSFYEKGVTPNDSLTKETALYRKVMSLLAQYKDEAAAWYQKELDKRNNKQKRSS